jgi:photosystem II stability/assembly factor-like uncharacterized protein
MSPTRRTSSPYRITLLALLVTLVPSAALAQQLSPDLLHGLQWRLIGPHRGGRVTSVAGIAGDSKTYYMGTPGGGVWKTTNAGRTWFPIFDAAHVASIADLVVAPSNPNVIYVATGEQTNGNGVWKSTDAGATWTNIGLRDSRKAFSILVDPRDANLVYVAALGDSTGGTRGIFKSTDGGTNWRRVAPKDETWTPYELDFDSNDSHTIVAALRHVRPKPGEKVAEGLDTLLLKSTDAGETWSPLGDQGLPPAPHGRVGLSIAAGLNGKRMFALMAQGLFRSDDAGASWQKITTDPRILGSEYFGRVYSDPKNPDVVYVMQTATYRSSDGGRTFVSWKGTPSGEDDHALWIAPDDPNRILIGTDQGAVITVDCGASWTSWFNQPTGQFYRVNTDNGFPYRLYAAQQDSGSVVVPSRTDFGLITYRDWFSSGSFESSFIAPDPLNPDYIYSAGWYGSVIRLDRTTGQIATLFVSPASYSYSWETPVLFSARDPHALFFASQFLVKSTDAGHTWKEISPNLTERPPVSAEASKGAAGGPCNDHFQYLDSFSGPEGFSASHSRAFIQSVAPSPLDANLIWVGTSNGLIQVTRDGSTWSNVSPPEVPERSVVNSIGPSPHDPNVAFIAVIACGDSHPYLFRTSDGGKRWDTVVTGLPEQGIAHAVREDTVRKSMLFAGTQTGVFVSFDSGDHWQPLQLNLPTAEITDLAIHGNDLVVSTFGRGLWILDDISPLRELSENSQKMPVQFFAPETATRVRWDNHPDTPLQRDFPASPNPPDGAILYYSLTSAPKGEITLDILDEKGSRLRQFSSAAEHESIPPANVPEYWFSPSSVLPTATGINRFVWDLRLPHPVTLPYSYFGQRIEYTEYTLPDHAVPDDTPRFQPPGPLVPPGTYTLVLNVEGKSHSQKLRVAADPRVHVSQADFAAQFDLSRRISDLMKDSAASFEPLIQIQDQLGERKKSLPPSTSKELTDAVAEAEKQINAITTGSDEAPGFGTINRDVARYFTMVQSGDIAPTESLRNAFSTSCEAYAKDLTAAHKLASETLPALNKLLTSEKLAALAYNAPSKPATSCAP